MHRLNLTDHPHRRYNLLTGEWILVSPQRAKRPWQGKVENPPGEKRLQYDPGCYLCPGNRRAGGHHNPVYESTFVFDNDFSALKPGVGEETQLNRENLLIAASEPGICRVVCFSPRHDLTLAEMTVADIHEVVEVWADEYRTLGGLEFINYVQIFENKGEIMGCSNPHPHGQIWAQRSVPGEPAKESAQMLRRWESHQRSLLADYLELELREQERVVCRNEHFVTLVPFWAIWPFETLIISRRKVGSLLDFTEAEKEGLAEMLKRVTAGYDRLFGVSFPYSAGLHQAPTDGRAHPEWHFHVHFYPPLLRSAAIKKFMVGYEMLGEPQRDITPEESAERLRSKTGILPVTK